MVPIVAKIITLPNRKLFINETKEMNLMRGRKHHALPDFYLCAAAISMQMSVRAADLD